MLEAARASARDGIDIVVGYVEPHGRVETERLLEGLEQLPSLPVRYRGTVRREFDLDAASAAPPRDLAGRRARALEPRRRRAAAAAREALAGHRGTARRRHQRLDDRQRPAPREPQRPRRADHRRAAARDHPGPHLRRGRRSRADRPAAGRPARAAQGRQGLSAGAGRRRPSIASSASRNLLALRELALRRTADRVDAAARARVAHRPDLAAVARARPPAGRGRAGLRRPSSSCAPASASPTRSMRSGRSSTSKHRSCCACRRPSATVASTCCGSRNRWARRP